jgi:hypothetical protein
VYERVAGLKGLASPADAPSSRPTEGSDLKASGF